MHNTIYVFETAFSLQLTILVALMAWTPASDVQAQTLSVSGSVSSYEENDTTPLAGASIQLFSLPDSIRTGGTTTGNEGLFLLKSVEPGSYLVIVSFLGFLTETETIQLEQENIGNLDFIMQPAALLMEDIQVTSRRPRVDVRGDTTLFHADGYRTTMDASAEDLVTRMPGFMLENGQIQAQGEDIQRVLVDGEEFFGDDALLTLRNLPAEIIEKIEVFDRQSDQARFTGFNDGNGERTVNVVTRRGMNTGQFGRANSGYGSETRYMAGGNYNHFDGSRRLSLIGMSNNVNQQNFSSEDLLGISQAGEGGGRGRRSTRNFRVGGQSGISSVHSTGLNYNDRWNDSWRINSSYFFNMTDNVNNQNRERQYLSGSSTDQIYGEDTYSTSDNYNHRFNMRVEHTINDDRSLIITPRLDFQQNNRFRTLSGTTMSGNARLLNEISSDNRSDNSGYNIAGNILYRHRFDTDGRTFSARLGTNVNDRSGDRFQYDESHYYGETENSIVNDRETETLTGGYTFSGDFSYTEPVSKKSQVMISYRPDISRNNSVQDAYLFDEETGNYSRIDTTLSNRYDNLVHTQQARGSYRYRDAGYNANVSFSFQYTSLVGEQTFPDITETSKSWRNFLPDASFRYRYGNGANLRFSYNANTRTPSARQLQDVIDNSSPLRMTTGNPDLNQQLDHRFSLRFRSSDSEKGSSTMAYLSLGYTQDHIGNRTFVAPRDTVLQEGIALGRGSRLVYTDNIGDSWNLRSMLNRSMPLDLLQSNMSFNGGVSFRRRPSVIDDERNLADNTGFNAGFSTSSNISENIDFRLSYRASYHIVENSIRPELNNNYYSGRATGNINLMPWKGLVLASDLNLRHYEGLGENYNENTVYWNGSAGYKFMEDRAAEFRITLFDILAQNNNINRSVAEDYIEDYRSTVLTRFFLLTFTYNLRSFPGGR
ncbi:MAG: outer membrane beta-barrel protein [Balneolaceae bacterium]